MNTVSLPIWETEWKWLLMTFYIIWVAQLIRDTAELPCDLPCDDLSQLAQFKLWMHQQKAASGCSLQSREEISFPVLGWKMEWLEGKKKGDSPVHLWMGSETLSKSLKLKCKELFGLLLIAYWSPKLPLLAKLHSFLYFYTFCLKLWSSIDVHSHICCTPVQGNLLVNSGWWTGHPCIYCSVNNHSKCSRNALQCQGQANGK